MHHAANLLLLLLLTDASIAQEVERAQGRLKGADGARLFYETVGEAPDTLVFVHGTPSTMYSLARDFDRLADQFTLVFFDQRGGGRSEPLLEPDALSWQMHVRDLEAVREHFNLDRMNLLGMSWGSALVSLYAAEYPNHINRLILLPMRARKDPDVPEGASPPPVVLDEEVKARLGELRATWETAADPVEVCERYWSILAPLLLHEPDRMRGNFCDEPAEVLRYTWRVSDARMGSLGDFDFRPILSEVRAPVLVVKGTYTSMYPEWTEEWARALPNSRLLWIEGAGGLPWLDEPGTVFSAISTFLSGQWPDGAKALR